MKTVIAPAMEGQTLDRIVDAAAAAPMRSVSIEDDQEFRALVKHEPGEKLGEFVTSCGLGRAIILAQHMTADQIAAFC